MTDEPSSTLESPLFRVEKEYQNDGRVGVVLSHTVAKCAIGWGTHFRAITRVKQILRDAQDDSITAGPLRQAQGRLSASLGMTIFEESPRFLDGRCFEHQ